MGIALGIGLLVGVRAAVTGSVLLLLPLLGTLILLVVPLSSKLRALPFLFGAGCLLGATIGAWRMPEPVDPPDDPASWTEFRGDIVDDPRLTETGAYTTFQWVDGSGGTRESTVILPPVPGVALGDEVVVSGEFAGPDGGLILADAVRVESTAGPVERARHRLRRWISQGMHRYVPGSPGTLALGLVTGDDSGLTEQERTDLRRSGLTHITAVSGWNVTLVLVIAGYLFAVFGWREWYWLVVQGVALLVYVWMVGLEPPITRAAIMGALALIGLHIGRPAHTLTLLALAAGIMAAISPGILGSLAFQLSALSMIGLVVVGRVVLELERPASIVLAPALMSGAAGLATAPLLAARFGTFSLATIPANIVVALFVSAAAIGGVITVVLQMIPVVSVVTGWLVWIGCNLILEISRVTAGLPGAFWTFAPLSAAETVGLYLLLAVLALPLLPEGRALVRALSDWIEETPGRALFTGAGVFGVAVSTLLMI